MRFHRCNESSVKISSGLGNLVKRLFLDYQTVNMLSVTNEDIAPKLSKNFANTTYLPFDNQEAIFLL